MTLYEMKKITGAVLVVALFGFTPIVMAQDKPADNMQILRDKIRADKKLVVATNMELTESEAKDFWPIYDQYQKDLQKINQRIANVLEGYAADFRGGRHRAGGSQSQKHLCAEVKQSAAGEKSRPLSTNREQDPRRR